MAIASFANKTFQVSSKKLYTFTEFASGGALQTEKQDVAGKKPSTYIKGTDLETMSFNVPINIYFGIDPQTEYDSWMAIMNSKTPHSFILGNKPFRSSKWLLVNVSLSDAIYNKKAKLIKGMIQLQFEEYVRSGKAESKSSQKKTSAKKSKAKGVSESDKKILNSLVSETDKSSQKRSNSNAATAAANGVKK